MRGFFVPLLFLFIIMGNSQRKSSSLGEASRDYLPPEKQATASRQAAEKARKQLTENLQGDWRNWIESKEAILRTLHQWALVPAAYHKTDDGRIEMTHAIERDHTEYQHIFDQARRRALELELQFDACTPDERFLIHLYALQEAINELIRPHQDQAEGHMKEIITTAQQKGETIIATKTVKNNDAELCNLKSMIAKHYFQEYYPEASTKMANAAEYKWWTDGHNLLHVQHGWASYVYHANSPRDGLPTLEWLNAQQEQFLQELQEMNTTKEKQTPSAQIRQLTPSSYHRLAA